MIMQLPLLVLAAAMVPLALACKFDTPPTSCATCIGVDVSCSWCTDDAFEDQRKGPQYRCGTAAELTARGCKSIESPKSSIQITKDDELSDNNQIKPQEISVRARTNELLQIEFQFKQAYNYPVDLYILSDKSHSMRDFLQSVANMTESIQKTLHDLTVNWRIGVGFFVDKPVFPYIQPNPTSDPCGTLQYGERCIDTFSYIHAMNLSQNAAELKQVTAAQTISANLDAPEGSLDALLQAVVCGQKIGWRNNSRKIVMLAVDGGFHMAGDGRFGGIIEPYPETECHLDTGRNKLNVTGSLEYVNATRFDYPSIGQVAKVLLANKVSVIFALKSDSYKSLYTQLKEVLPVQTEVDLITNNQNVLSLIKKNYHAIAELVEISVTKSDAAFEVKLEAKCPGETAFKSDEKCSKVGLGETVQYRATVNLTRCLKGSGHKTLQFNSKTSSDRLEVRVTTLCSCPDCEAKADSLGVVAKCLNRGHLECGVCKCHGNLSGDSCECDSKEGAKIDQCRDTSTPGGPVCSQRGRCVCNKCLCSEDNYYGKYCELDRQSCYKSWDTQEMCGGPARGHCDGKGTCVCNPNYSEKDCSCSTSAKENPDCESRKEQYKGMDCSNHGTCICGRCACEAMWSSDRYCDTKAGSTGSLCNDLGLQACVQCVFDHRDKSMEERLAKCNCTLLDETVFVDKSRIQLASQRDVISEKSTCVLNLANECTLLYGYVIGDGTSGLSARNMSLYIQGEKQCRDRVAVLTLVLIVVAAVVIVGVIILVIWKLLVTISDKREFAKFVKTELEAKHAAGENPLFQDPTTTVKNPLFEGMKST